MSLVVDASIAVKFVVEEPGSDAAYEIAVGPEPLLAPDWLLAEVASALWKMVKFSRILELHAEDSLGAIAEFFSRIVPASTLIEDALRLAFRLRHPVYDCLYLALAIREDADLITADRDFYRASRRSLWASRVRLLEW